MLRLLKIPQDPAYHIPAHPWTSPQAIAEGEVGREHLNGRGAEALAKSYHKRGLSLFVGPLTLMAETGLAS